MVEAGRQVKLRRVFYIPGFDPFPPRRYRELYRTEAAIQSLISGHKIVVSRGRGGDGWHVNAVIEDLGCASEFEVLVWSDLVQASTGQGIVSTYLQLFRTAWLYSTSGTLRQLIRLRKGPAIAALYPFIILLLQGLVSLAVGFGIFMMLPDVGLPSMVSFLLRLFSGAVIIWLILAAFRRVDSRIFAWYLMHDYAHSAAADGAYSDNLRSRLSAFAARVSDALIEEWDEVLLIGHSSGAHMAVTVMAEVIRQRNGRAGGPELSLLTLGHVVPMISFLPAADGLRSDLRYLSNSDRIGWIDVTAPGDGCSFALCDPVAVTGVAPPDQRWPLVLSAAFSQTLSPSLWRSLRRRYFRLHFQYLCAFDNLSGRKGDYDYFAVTAGPLTLVDRFGDRNPSASRIVTPLSPHRSLAVDAA